MRIRSKVSKEVYLVDREQGRERYNIGRDAFVKLAKEANAVVKIGRSTRYNTRKIESYLDSISE